MKCSPSILGGALLVAAGCAAKPLVHDPAADVTYRGTEGDGVEHFQDIKFALDTAGARRFAPPVPYRAPPGSEVDATARGAACPQLEDGLPPFFSAEPVVSEDCLSVHIARPAGDSTTADSKLPVLVWLHGGGVVKGSAYDEHSDPDRLVRLSVEQGQPVIYAALNYRVGVFGFARSEGLKAAKSLNAGFRDQRAGLEWVRDNIAAFGGDPARITVFGLSAGGTLSSVHHVAYGGEKGVPFTQAFMMSGPPGTCMNTTADATTIHTKNLAMELGCETTSDAKMIECLREVPMETLRDAGMKYSVANHPPNGLFTFIPSVDDDILPDRPSKLLREGRFAKGIPSILAWTEDDGAMNVGPGHLITGEEDMKASIRNFATRLTDAEFDALFALYPVGDFDVDVHNYESRRPAEGASVSPHYFRISRILRDLLFTCSSFDFTYQMVRHTRASGGDAGFDNVRHYTLNQSMLTPLWAAFGMPYVQVSHGSDQNYIFNALFPEGQVGDDDAALSRRFSSSIISFAATGDPVSRSSGSSTFEEWPVAYTGDLGEGDASVLTMAPELNLLVVGGPYGTVPVSLSRSSSASSAQRPSGDGAGPAAGSAGGVLGKMQQVLGDAAAKYGVMRPAKVAQAEEILAAQKLFERCEYINSLGDLLGN